MHQHQLRHRHFNDSEFQAERKPATDLESTPALDLTGGVELTTAVYLEDAQALELSAGVESNAPTLWKSH